MKMIQVATERANQEAFLFAYAQGQVSGAHWNNLLLAVIGGADSAVQAIKAAIDSGLGVYIGEPTKEGYRYTINNRVYVPTEKGAYRSFVGRSQDGHPFAIIVHKNVLSGDVLLAFRDNLKAQWRAILQRKYGTPCLKDWEEKIWAASQQYLEPIETYTDETYFPPIEGFNFSLTEQEADQLISRLVINGAVKFPAPGSGKKIETYADLTEYMQEMAKLMAEKVANQIKVIYDPSKEEPDPILDQLATKLFPMQAHVVTAGARFLQRRKSMLLHGEMSTGKSKMGTALAHLLHKGKKGYHALVACPPTLTSKWAEEIHSLLPHAKTIWVENTETLIRWHRDWVFNGRPEPEVPTFFIVGWTTLRNGPKIEPAVQFQQKRIYKEGKQIDYRVGYYCPRCGQPHKEKDGTIMLDFGDRRRREDSKLSQNSHCRVCGEQFWAPKTIQRLKMREWFKYSSVIEECAKNGDYRMIQELQKAMGDLPSSTEYPRRVAAIEYLKRKMRGFFDIAIVDEIHELKGGTTAQGNALGGIVSVCKKVVGMTGTLFGGYASNLFYILWRLFPSMMKQSGMAYKNLEMFVREYGNFVKTEKHEEVGNKASRGRKASVTTKEAPGVSTFLFTKFLMPNMISIGINDLGVPMPDNIELPPILVEMDPELKAGYMALKTAFEKAMQDSGGRRVIGGYPSNAMSYPDKPFGQKPYYHPLNGELIWIPTELPENKLYNKERKLQDIVRAEIAENRRIIIFVRDSQEKDIQPRLKWVVEQIPGVKAEILRSNTTKTNQRTQWMYKMVEKGVNVFIANAELVKVGLDLLMVPTIIFYQLPWSLYTIQQAGRRAWRINQKHECRNYFLVYTETLQEYCATLMARKEKAAKALNGEVSSDGLSAIVGGEEDLRSLLIEAIKQDSLSTLKYQKEKTVSNRAKELLAAIEMVADVYDDVYTGISIVGEDQLAFDFGIA